LTVSAAAAVAADSTKPLGGPEFEAADDIAAAASKEINAYADTLLRTEATTIAGLLVLARSASVHRVALVITQTGTPLIAACSNVSQPRRAYRASFFGVKR